MKRRTFHRGNFFAFLLLAALAAGMISLPGGIVSAAPAHTCPAAITVTSSADSGANTLRQAMADICASGTISFNNDTIITLTSASLTIAKNMTIDGTGHNVTVSGNNTLGIFSTNSGVTANLNHLTITEGNASQGGGITNNGGTLTVQNSTLSNNSASLNGGGIYNSGTLTVQNSTFSGNWASNFSGGGIFNGVRWICPIRSLPTHPPATIVTMSGEALSPAMPT
jgi:hypothetical protein